jgi:hypothetical protein
MENKTFLMWLRIWKKLYKPDTSTSEIRKLLEALCNDPLIENSPVWMYFPVSAFEILSNCNT